MIPLAAIILCLLSASSANARLGETIEECDARYGTPPSRPNLPWPVDPLKLRSYRVTNIAVNCTFVNGKCSEITYLLLSWGNPKSILTEDEVFQFLNKNSKNNNFQLSSDKDGILTYYEQESGRLAFFRKGFTTDLSLPRGKLRILDEVESFKLIYGAKNRKEQLDKL